MITDKYNTISYRDLKGRKVRNDYRMMRVPSLNSLIEVDAANFKLRAFNGTPIRCGIVKRIEETSCKKYTVHVQLVMDAGR